MRSIARVCLSLPLALASLSASPTYSICSLGSFGNQAAGIGAGGVGFFTDSSGKQTPLSFAGAGFSSLSGIGQANQRNSSGAIIGTTYDGQTATVTEWLNGQQNTFGLKGYGNAINNNGQFAGGYIGSDQRLHAFVGSGSTVNDIGGLGGDWSSAQALNNFGQAAGSSKTVSGSFHGFFWDGFTMHDLGTLGGANSYGSSINARGLVVGSSQVSSGYLHAFTFNHSGMLDLGTLGGGNSAAYGVNDGGDVVGYSSLADGSSHAFLARDGVMFDLNTLLPANSGWTLDHAYSIDNSGTIYATGMHNGSECAVQLSPGITNGNVSAVTPEPAAMGLAGIGLIGCAMFGRKARLRLPGRSSRKH